VCEFLEIIRKKLPRMSRLTETCCPGARGIGEQRFDIQEVSAQELLQSAGKLSRGGRSYGVELVEENAAPGRIVDADREAIQQVFSNLMKNSFKYASVGKKVVLGPRVRR